MRAGAPPETDRVAGVGPPTVRVRLFGELAFEIDGRPLPPVESARARSLLAYLILHRDVAHPRQRLAFLLWPDSTEAQARTNLRKVLHTLRRETPALEPFLATTAQTVQWASAGPLEVDVEVFEAQSTAGADGDAAHRIVALRRALESYAGDLLEGSYDEWLDEVRERLRDRYVAVLSELAPLLSDRGEHSEAVRLGRELVRRESMREASHQLLMALYSASGDRAAAVRAYHQCVSTLQRELGVAPSRETDDAYAALTRPSPADATDSLPPIGPTGLVGRDDEWASLTQMWRDVVSGRPQLVVVSGEAGVGKTRLVEEFAAWCAHEGAAVASGRAYPTEGDLGFGVAISWLRGGLRARLQRAPRPDRAELARLLPELETAPEGSSSVTDDAEQRRRLFDAVARVVVGDRQPVLLVVDDAQWSDTQSLQLLHYLLRFDPGAALLAVATTRREELRASHPLHELLDSLAVADRLTELALGRLSRDATEALARDFVGGATSSEIDELYAETEGNPLFIVESVRAGWPATSNPSVVSPRLQAVITSRLRQLTPASRDLLGLAASVGRDFTVSLLREASPLDERELARSLDEVWRRGLVREHGFEGYDFSHGRIRDVVYGELEPAVRRHNHLVVADSLRRLHEPAVEAVTGQIAYHFDRSGRPDEAISWYRRGASEAQRRSANPEAIRLLDRALELVGALPEADRPPRELEVLTALPTPLAGVEGFVSDRLVATQRRAVHLAGAIGAQPEPAVLRSVVMSRLCRDEFDEALVVAGQLRDRARRTGDDGLLVESTYLLGIGTFWSGRLEEARDLFVDVVDRFPPGTRPDHIVRFGQDPQIVCLSRLGNTLRFLGDLDGARRARDDAVAMAEEMEHPFSRGVALIFASLLAIDLGETDRLVDYVSALRRDPHPARPNDIKTEALAGYAEIVVGNRAEGLAQVHRVVDRSGAVNHAPGFRAALLRLLVAAHLLAEEPEGGLAAADLALGSGGTRLWETDVRVARAHFLETLQQERPGAG